MDHPVFIFHYLHIEALNLHIEFTYMTIQRLGRGQTVVLGQGSSLTHVKKKSFGHSRGLSSW